MKLFRGKRTKLYGAAVFFSLCWPLWSQFEDLATMADGSAVYFATRYRRTGTEDPVQGRIYVADGRGLRLFAERRKETLPGTPVLTNYYSLSAPEVAGDGSLIAYTGTRDCESGRQCTGVQTSISFITGAPRNGELAVPGRIRFSPNGRYALRYPTQGIGGDLGGLLDLQTGRDVAVASLSTYNLAWPGRAVADDGTIVAIGGGVELIRGQQTRRLTDPFGENPAEAAIDAAARVVVYSSRWYFPESAFSRLRVVDVATGAIRTLVEGLGDFHQPVLSNDGRRVLFVTTCRFDDSGRVGQPQAYVIGMDGTGLRPAIQDPAGIKTAILSGDGRVAYGVTVSGRLVRADLESARETEVIPRTLSLRPGSMVAAGSLATVIGPGYPGPDGRMEPLRAVMGGREVPIISLSPGKLIYQVPWEFAGQQVPFRIETTLAASPFEPPPGSFDYYVNSRLPELTPLPEEHGTDWPRRFAKAVTADYSALLTRETPARPGDIVNVYASGLGPVDPPVRTGEAAPAGGPLSRVTEAFECKGQGRGEEHEVPILFAGLAPGLVGVYQVQLRIPRELPLSLAEQNRFQIVCSTPGQTGSPFIGYLPVRVEQGTGGGAR